MGELCFYVMTQSDKDGQQVKEQKEGDAAKPKLWTIPKVCQAAMVRCVRQTEDSLVQLYTWKSLENVVTENREFSRYFASDAILVAALPILTSTSQQASAGLSTTGAELLRATVFSTVSRLSRLSVDFAVHVLRRMGTRRAVSLMEDTVVAVQQSVLNVLNCALVSTAGSQLFKELLDVNGSQMVQAPSPTPSAQAGPQNSQPPKSAMPVDYASILTRLMQHSNQTVRTKALVHLHVLLLNVSSSAASAEHDETVLSLLMQRCAAVLDKLASDKKDKRLSEVVELVIQQVVHRGKMYSARLFKDASAGSNMENTATLLCRLAEYRVFLERIFDVDVLEMLASFFDKSTDAVGGDEHLRKLHVAFQVLEQVTKDPEVVLSWKATILQSLLPSMVSILTREHVNDDVRFFALKKVIDILSLYLSPQAGVYDPMQPKLPTTRRINELVVRSMLPQYARVLDAAEPTPMYAIKFLSLLCETNVAMVSVLVRLNLLPVLMSYLDVQHRNHNVHLVRLFVYVLQSEEVDRAALLRQDLPAHVYKIVDRAWKNEMEDFYDPMLELTSTLLYQCSQLIMSQQQGGKDAEKMLQLSLEKNKPLKHVVPLLIEMIAARHAMEDVVSEKAALCVQLAAQIYPSSHAVLLDPTRLAVLEETLKEDLPHVHARGARSRRLIRALFYVASYDARNATVLKSSASAPGLLDVLTKLADSHDGGICEIAHQTLRYFRS
jgi:hypothetical protein